MTEMDRARELLAAELERAGHYSMTLASEEISLRAIAAALSTSGREEGLEEAAKVIDRIIGIGVASPFWDDNQVQMFRDAAEQIRALKHGGGAGA